jgi:hypothetical protein
VELFGYLVNYWGPVIVNRCCETMVAVAEKYSGTRSKGTSAVGSS